MNENNKLQIENKKGNNGKMERKGKNVNRLSYIITGTCKFGLHTSTLLYNTMYNMKSFGVFFNNVMNLVKKKPNKHTTYFLQGIDNSNQIIHY